MPLGPPLGSATNNLYSSPLNTQLECSTYRDSWSGVRKFEICSFGPWGPPLGPPIGATCTMNNFESPCPLGLIPAMFGYQIQPSIFQKEMKHNYLLQIGPTGPYWGHPGNCHEQLLFLLIRYLRHYITWPFSFWMRSGCVKFAWSWLGAIPLGPHGGHTNDLNNFIPKAKDDSCQVWLKSNHNVFKKYHENLSSLRTTLR